MRGVGSYPCESCRRVFGGAVAFDKHRIGTGENRRCRTARELRRAGLRRRSEGTWVRDYSRQRQLRVFALGRPQNGWYVEMAPGPTPEPQKAPRRTPTFPRGPSEPDGAA